MRIPQTRRPARLRRAAGLVAMALALAACGEGPGTSGAPQPTSTTVADPAVDEGPKAAPRWEQVTTFSGAAALETPAFTIAPGAIQWRARYQCDTGSLTVATLPPPDTPEPLVDSGCPDKGEGFSIQTGELRLGVEASGAWDITVEQQVDTPIDEPPLPELASAPVLAAGSFYSIDEDGSGTATLYDLPDGRRALRFEDFEVFNNTDLVVWLSEAPMPTTSAESVEAPLVEIAELKSTIGPQNYLVPDDLPTERIRSVIIWCPPISSAYIAATLEP
ncbi:MAG: DM13 domain-containing protein [Acidimicrobiales bacterium]